MRKKLQSGAKCHIVSRNGDFLHPEQLSVRLVCLDCALASWGSASGELEADLGFRQRIWLVALQQTRERMLVMFVGQYEHALDEKGRVVLPAPFRAFVADRGYVTQLDGCIGLWSSDDFRVVAEKWKSESEASRISMRVFRKLMNSVREVKLDSAGRITMPRELLEELNFNSQVIVSGLFDRVEIWPAEAYEADQNNDSAASELAEAVARLGL